MKKKKGEVKVATKTPRHQGTPRFFLIINPLVYLCAFVRRLLVAIFIAVWKNRTRR